MPDISLCSNDKCPKRKVCYRAQAESSSPWQSYSEFDFKRDKCFIKLTKKKRTR